MTNTAFPDLRRKQRAKAVRPVPHRFVRDVDTAFVKQIFHLSQGQWKSHIKYHSEADDLGRTFEITEGIVHQRKLRDRTSRLKQFCSDNALTDVADYFVSGILCFLRTLSADLHDVKRPHVDKALGMDT